MKNEFDDELDNILFQEFQNNFKEPEDYEKRVQVILEKAMMTNSRMGGIHMNKKSLLKTVASIVLTIGLTVGVVYAGFNFENIKNFILGGGIGTAVEHGYIESPEMNVIEQDMSVVKNEGIIVDDVNVELKVDDFTMDDTNLCVNFTFNFSDNIKEYIDLGYLHLIELKELVVTDEENRILFENLSDDNFEKYCKKHNLEYKKENFNENYINSGVNIIPNNIDKEKSDIHLMYNMYGYKYPKSKKLHLEFAGIMLTEYNRSGNHLEENAFTLKGDWKIDLDVPEKMYNRISESYRVVNTSNDNFEVYSAKVSDTGFEFGVIIRNCEDTMSDAEYINKTNELHKLLEKPNITDEENLEISKKIKEISDYKLKVIITDKIDSNNNHVKPTYMMNSEGKRFEVDLTLGKQQKNNRIDENTYDYYSTFEMTKFDATDKAKVILDYRGEIVTIELEKVK